MTMPTEKPTRGKDYYRGMDSDGYQYGGFCNGLHFWTKQSIDHLNMPRYATIQLPESWVCELPYYIEHGLTYNPLADGTLTTAQRKAWRKVRAS